MVWPISGYPILSPNLLAYNQVMKMIDHSKQLLIDVQVKKGVTVIDCGINVPGGIEAGLQFASVCLGGMAEVQLQWLDFNALKWPAVQVITDFPLRACLVSQLAGWPIEVEDFSAMASGPGRATASFEEIFEEIHYEDTSQLAIVCLESDLLPNEKACQYIAEKCGCKPEKTYILVAPASSLVGSVQVAARALETAVYKLRKLEYELRKLRSGLGLCPLITPTSNNEAALGRINDAILYGSIVHFYVRDEDDKLASLVTKVPFSASSAFGETFGDILRKAKGFYNIDPLLFSPAEIRISNLKSGRTFKAGVIQPEMFLR